MDEASSETVVPVEPEEAWEAITEPERLREWFAEDVELELEPGGEVTVHDGGERRTGFVEEVEVPRRLVFWWAADGDDESSRVAIELIPDEAGTRVRVVETRPLATLGSHPGPRLAAVA